MEQSEQPVVVVKDANALIDLANGGVLAYWFQLGIRTITTNLVLREIKGGPQWIHVQPHVETSNLEVLTLSPSEMESMHEAHPNLRVSVADRSVLFLAAKENGILLSGDGKVRSEARLAGIEVRGVLWILQRLVEERVIAPDIAATSLRSIVDAGAFLPEDLVAACLADWED